MFSASKSKGASSDYQIFNSLRFRSSASAYLNRTPASAGNRQTWTWSGWVKRGALGVYQNIFHAINGSDRTQIQFLTDNTLGFYFANTTGYSLNTTQVFRDPSAWYHLVAVADTTQATAANRLKLYVNGTQITSFSTATYPAQNFSGAVNLNVAHQISSYDGAGFYFDGYLADINFIDGQALTPSSFGAFNATTGVWGPIAYTGTYGTNGFKLNFSNGTSTTTLGYDSSGNGNNWTCNNISLTAGSTYDWMLDSPTPLVGTSYGVGNYCTFNPINANATVSDGNLKSLSSGSWVDAMSTMALPIGTGKWYVEATVLSLSNSCLVGVTNTSIPAGSSDNWRCAYVNDGTLARNGFGQSNTTGLSTFTTNDVIGIAVDCGAGTVTFYKNNSSINTTTASAFTTTELVIFTRQISSSWAVNFGQRPFAYTPPSGYKSLCTYNLPTPTIQNGAGYMAATIYTGNGSTQTLSNAVNGVSFQPDFVWTKSRSAVAWHSLVDSVRGIYKNLFSNATNAETTYTNYTVTAFNNNGASIADDSAGSYAVNGNGITYVSWQWKAGGTAVTNTAGSITSSVSANTTSGFSVITYTGTGVAGTIGHGLGVTPAFIITKSRSDATTQWVTWHKDLSGAFSATCGYLYLNSTNAASTTTIFYNGTQINSSTIGLQGTGTNINNTGSTYVTYAFSAISGFSAFGSYTGNGSTDGPFVYCGFRPRYVLIKRTDSANWWQIWDSSRNTYNDLSNYLQAESSNAENNNGASVVNYLDALSNGFKLRLNVASANASGGTYIYAAFAENPFQNALAR